MNKTNAIIKAVNDLRNIAAVVQLQTQQHELAVTILDCADQLDIIVNKEETHG